MAKQQTLQFFEFPTPSCIKSQFMPSVRASPGWQPLQLCQFWKQWEASLKYFSPLFILLSVRPDSILSTLLHGY